MATLIGATIGAFVFFWPIATLLIWPLKAWASIFLKRALAILPLYVAATALFAWGDADELRRTMTFVEVVAGRANWLLYAPGAFLVWIAMSFRELRKQSSQD